MYTIVWNVIRRRRRTGKSGSCSRDVVGYPNKDQNFSVSIKTFSKVTYQHDFVEVYGIAVEGQVIHYWSQLSIRSVSHRIYKIYILVYYKVNLTNRSINVRALVCSHSWHYNRLRHDDNDQGRREPRQAPWQGFSWAPASKNIIYKK